MKRGALYLDDPEDLGKCSSGFFHLYLQLEALDLARRYYKRQKDAKSLKRSKEIKKLLNKISELQTDAVRALIPIEILQKCWEIKEKNREPFT